MDSSGSEELWRELRALRARVEALERGSAAPVEQVPAEVSFVQPERPTLESRIGSQLFNRVGIVALLVGVAWFLKYAVDREWLGAPARIVVGFLAGFGLIGWSERFRRGGYPVFSFSLKAAGTGVLYLSLWASYSLFHLVGFPLAFAGMALVTAGNVWLCARQQSEALAAVAMVGGFLTPALLGASPDSVWALGSYLLLLNAGFWALLLRFGWARLLPGAFVGTQAYLLLLAVRLPSQLGERGAALAFAAVFLLGFSVVAARIGGGLAAVVVTVANAGLGAFEVWRFVPDAAPARWVPVGVAGWFALFLLGRFRGVVGGLLPWFAGLVVGFAAVGVWTVGSGGGVVFGWGLEAAVLWGLTLRGGLMGSPVAGAVLLGLAAGWLLAESATGALGGGTQVVWNVRFALYVFLAGVAVLGVRLAARAGVEEPFAAQWRRVALGASGVASGLVLTAGLLEIHGYWGGSGAERFADSAWVGAMGLGLLVLGFGVRWAWLRWQGLGLLLLAVGKVFVVDTRALSQGFRILSFLGLGVLLLLVSFIYQRDLLNLRGREHEG